MSKLSKLAGLVAGASMVTVLGVAIAQGQPPNPLIGNHAIAAGQQSTHITPMGETGVLTQLGEVRTAVIQTEAQVAYVAPAPAVVPAPEPVQQVAIVQPTATMGAAPAEPAPATPARMVKQDRN